MVRRVRYAARRHGLAAFIIDTDDVMYSRPVVEKLCTYTGMDAETLQCKWDTKKNEETANLTPGMSTFLRSLNESRGTVAGKDSKGLDLAVQRQNWAEEFGEDWASWLMSKVRDTTGDYEYLWAKRLQAE